MLYIKKPPNFLAVKILSHVNIPEQCSEIHDGQFLCTLLLPLQPLGRVHPTQHKMIKE